MKVFIHLCVILLNRCGYFANISHVHIVGQAFDETCFASNLWPFGHVTKLCLTSKIRTAMFLKNEKPFWAFWLWRAMSFDVVKRSNIVIEKRISDVWQTIFDHSATVLQKNLWTQSRNNLPLTLLRGPFPYRAYFASPSLQQGSRAGSELLRYATAQTWRCTKGLCSFLYHFLSQKIFVSLRIICRCKQEFSVLVVVVYMSSCLTQSYSLYYLRSLYKFMQNNLWYQYYLIYFSNFLYVICI